MTKYWHVLETPIYGYGGDCILDVNVMFHIGVAYYFITTKNRHHQRRFLNLQESLAKAKVSARQQCVYEDQFCHLTVV